MVLSKLDQFFDDFGKLGREIAIFILDAIRRKRAEQSWSQLVKP